MEGKDLFAENCKILIKEIKDKNREIHTIILDWKNKYYPMQSTDSLQFLSNYQWQFSRN